MTDTPQIIAPHGSPGTTWEPSMRLRWETYVVVDAHGDGGGIAPRLQQLWLCRETGAVEWCTVEVEW